MSMELKGIMVRQVPFTQWYLVVFEVAGQYRMSWAWLKQERAFPGVKRRLGVRCCAHGNTFSAYRPGTPP